jgi:hypothetical protein
MIMTITTTMTMITTTAITVMDRKSDDGGLKSGRHHPIVRGRRGAKGISAPLSHTQMPARSHR